MARFHYKSAVLETVSHGDEGVYYIHPITGQECQEPSQVLTGWDDDWKEDLTELIEILSNGNFPEEMYYDDDNILIGKEDGFLYLRPGIIASELFRKTSPNEPIALWFNHETGKTAITRGSMEFRDDNHTEIISLKIEADISHVLEDFQEFVEVIDWTLREKKEILEN